MVQKAIKQGNQQPVIRLGECEKKREETTTKNRRNSQQTSDTAAKPRAYRQNNNKMDIKPNVTEASTTTRSTHEK